MAAPASRFAGLFERAARTTRLLSAVMEVTHRCHLACVHCYLEDNHYWQDKRRELTTEELCSIIDQLRAAGCLFLTITGGEIFLRPDILTVVRHARRQGLAVTLFTTGTLLTEPLIIELADLHPMCVEFSLYSTDPMVHDGITQRPGSHAETMWALTRLRAEGVRVLIKCPLMRQNIESYPGLKALAKGLGISFLADVTVTPMNNDDPHPTQYRLTLEHLADFFRDPEMSRFGTVAKRLPQPEDPLCAIGKRSCVIGPFGDVYTCMGFKHPVGNLREQSFAEIWYHSPLLNRVRAVTAKDLSVCSGCEKFSYCNRCAGMALSEDGDFLGPSSWACHLAAAKEKAAGLPVMPSAAERLGLVSVLPEGEGFGLKVLTASSGGGCRGCHGCSGSGGLTEAVLPIGSLAAGR